MKKTTESQYDRCSNIKVWECLAPLKLTSGEILPSFFLAFSTYGNLNPAGDNAVLICPALNASSEVCGSDHNEAGHAGWWDNMVGPGRPIDTENFFVVCVANLGSCFGSTESRSINPATGELYGADFPYVTVEDWVVSQERLSCHLGVEQFVAVVGGSMGGMQAMLWAVMFPHRVRHAIVIASTAKLNAQNIAFNAVARQAIFADPNFLSGAYVHTKVSPLNGLKIARMLGHITYASKEGLDRKFGRSYQGNSFHFGRQPTFQVESYLNHQAKKFASNFDANSYLRITRALDHFDLARDFGDGELHEALRCARAKFLIIAFCDDWRFGPEHSREIVAALKRADRQVSFEEIEGTYGHDGFLLNDSRYHAIVREYFDHIWTHQCRRVPPSPNPVFQILPTELIHDL